MQANLLTNVILPLSLVIIMLGMGLSLQLADFQRVTKYPKAVSVGLVSQLVVLPMIGFAITKILPMQPAIAVGLIIVTLCPGATSSNIVTYLAGGDTALSITLTVFSSIITIFTIPVLTNLALQHFFEQGAAITLPVGTTMLQIFLITIMPIGLGMYIRQRFKDTALRLEKATSRLGMSLLVIIIVLLVIQEWNRLPEYILQVGLGAIALNLTSTLAGFFIAKLCQLNIRQQICIAIEVGFQNTSLAFAITTGLLKNPDMGIAAAIYGLFMFFTGFAIIKFGKKLLPKTARHKGLVGRL